MPGSLLASQLATLEPLEADEAHIVVDIHADPAAVAGRVVASLTGVPASAAPAG